MIGLGAAIGSTIFCVFSRAVLNSIDRSVLKRPDVDFLSALIFNAVFPLVFAFLATLALADFRHLPFFELSSIMGGFASQIAGAVYSFSLGKMPVRSIITVNKSADFIIPLIPLVILQKFSLQDYVFSNLSTLALFPIGWSIFRSNEASGKYSLFLIGGLVFQVLIIQIFCSSISNESWQEFVKKVFCLLFWRTIFVGIPLLRRFIKTRENLQFFSFKLMICLLGRGLISYLSQIAFFFSITGRYALAMWPILNAGPLISCFTAHVLIKEKTGSAEKWAFGLFSVVTVIYFLYIEWVKR